MSRYREIGKIASGGAATVYLGIDANGRHVAIKRPHPHLFEDASALAAFEREIAVVARLHSANVVQLYEADQTGAVPELVLEYVDGLPLSDLAASWAEEGRREPWAALGIVRDVALGLAAVHELRGETGEPLRLVHRDVSPQNVLVGRDGGAKLTDFGLARSLARGDRSTTGGVLKGKAGYLAPEYIRGAPIDGRVDIFALGVVLWETLTGERLFAADNEAATLQRILTTTAPALTSRGVDLGAATDDVQAIVERATARSPSQRYADVRELVADLDAAIARHGLATDRAVVAASFGAAAEAKRAARLPRVAAPEYEAEPTVQMDMPAVHAELREAERKPRWPGVALALVVLAGAAAAVVHFGATGPGAGDAVAEPATSTSALPPAPSASPTAPVTASATSPVASAAAPPDASGEAAPAASSAPPPAHPPAHRPSRDPRPNPY